MTTCSYEACEEEATKPVALIGYLHVTWQAEVCNKHALVIASEVTKG